MKLISLSCPHHWRGYHQRRCILNSTWKEISWKEFYLSVRHALQVSYHGKAMSYNSHPQCIAYIFRKLSLNKSLKWGLVWLECTEVMLLYQNTMIKKWEKNIQNSKKRGGCLADPWNSLSLPLTFHDECTTRIRGTLWTIAQAALTHDCSYQSPPIWWHLCNQSGAV